jgi:hypothetical protein
MPHFSTSSNTTKLTPPPPPPNSLYRPAYANTRIKGMILQHHLILEEATSAQYFDQDGSTNATTCEQLLRGETRGSTTCDEAFAQNSATDFTCSNKCERPGTPELCEPWAATPEQVKLWGYPCGGLECMLFLCCSPSAGTPPPPAPRPHPPPPSSHI